MYNIKTLKIYFQIANFGLVVSALYEKDLDKLDFLSKMVPLHQQMLEYLETDEPDQAVITEIISKIEALIIENQKPKPNSPIGGLFTDIAVDTNRFGMFENSPSWQIS